MVRFFCIYTQLCVGLGKRACSHFQALCYYFLPTPILQLWKIMFLLGQMCWVYKDTITILAFYKLRDGIGIGRNGQWYQCKYHISGIDTFGIVLCMTSMHIPIKMVDPERSLTGISGTVDVCCFVNSAFNPIIFLEILHQYQVSHFIQS